MRWIGGGRARGGWRLFVRMTHWIRTLSVSRPRNASGSAHPRGEDGRRVCGPHGGLVVFSWTHFSFFVVVFFLLLDELHPSPLAPTLPVCRPPSPLPDEGFQQRLQQGVPLAAGLPPWSPRPGVSRFLFPVVGQTVVETHPLVWAFYSTDVFAPAFLAITVEYHHGTTSPPTRWQRPSLPSRRGQAHCPPSKLL